jgi:Tol biopolymer transport system component
MSGEALKSSGCKLPLDMPLTVRVCKASGLKRVNVLSMRAGALLLVSCKVWAGSAECSPPTTLVDFPIGHAIGAKWNSATSRLAYGKPRVDGHYATYLSDATGGHEQRLTFPEWRDDRHQFPAAWHPSGRYLVVTVEKADHPGSSVQSTPGYGGFSDYWLVTPDGARAWKLVELANDRDHAVTHAAFSPDGTKFVWTERIKAPRFLSTNLLAGSYRFNVADFVDGDSPHLAAIRSFIPDNVDQGGEVESMASDNKTIAFYSTFRSKSMFASRIYTMDIDSGRILELTTESWSQAPTFTPDGEHIVYITGAQADLFPWSLQGADWWIMRLDGTHKQRLTFMNRRGSPQSVGQFGLAGSSSFLSQEQFFGDVMTRSFGLTGKIEKVTIHDGCVD